MFKRFLKWISPIEILFFSSPDDPQDTLDTIDKEYQARFDELKNQETVARAYSVLMANIVQLCHTSAITAYTAQVALEHPELARKIEEHPEDKELLAEVEKLIKARDIPKELDQLGARLLSEVFESYPSLKEVNQKNALRMANEN